MIERQRIFFLRLLEGSNLFQFFGQLSGAALQTLENHSEILTIIGDHSGHNRHAGHSVAMFGDKFWLSLALTLPVVFWPGEIQRWLDYHINFARIAMDPRH